MLLSLLICSAMLTILFSRGSAWTWMRLQVDIFWFREFIHNTSQFWFTGIRREADQLLSVLAAHVAASGSWKNFSRGKEKDTSFKLLAAKNVLRPQMKFRKFIDNSTTAFQPMLRWLTSNTLWSFFRCWWSKTNRARRWSATLSSMRWSEKSIDRLEWTSSTSWLTGE